MTDQPAPSSTIEKLEQTVTRLLLRLEEIEQSNYNLRKQLQAQQLLGEQLSQKNSRAATAIRRIIQSMEGKPNE